MRQDGVADAARVVRVRTEVAAVAKTFDYAVPPGWHDDVHIGTRVRAPFHGRTVRGWVVDEDVGTPAGVDVLPLKSWLGWGPPPALVELAEWAAWRWAGPASFFLRIASPDTIVRTLPAVPPSSTGGAVPPAPGHEGLDLARRRPHGRARAAPHRPDRPRPVGRGGSGRAGPAGAACWCSSRPSGWAERLTARLVRRGCPTAQSWEQARAGWPVVVGSRAGAWAPLPRLAAVGRPRRARRGLPGGERSHLQRGRRGGRARPPGGRALRRRVARASGGAGRPTPGCGRWRRRGCGSVPAGPPWSGSIAAAPTRAAACSPRSSSAWPGRSSTNRRRVARGPLVCVYNRTGGARLLACRHCGELARCARCGAAAAQPRGEEVLRCPRCDDDAPGRVRGLRTAADEDACGPA